MFFSHAEVEKNYILLQLHGFGVMGTGSMAENLEDSVNIKL